MATLTVGLNINSLDVLSTNLGLSLQKNITVDSGNIIRAKVKGTAADTNDLCVYIANQCSDRAYLYVKNLNNSILEQESFKDTAKSNAFFSSNFGTNILRCGL